MTIKERYQKINLSEIDQQQTYSGYIWYSDESKPVLLNNSTFVPNFKQGIRFIVEGHLVAQNTSYQIKNIDGAYHVAKINLSGMVGASGDNWKSVDYFAHDTQPFQKYTMIEAWEEADLYTQGTLQSNQVPAGIELPQIKTLVPAWSAFKGFE